MQKKKRLIAFSPPPPPSSSFFLSFFFHLSCASFFSVLNEEDGSGDDGCFALDQTEVVLDVSERQRRCVDLLDGVRQPPGRGAKVGRPSPHQRRRAANLPLARKQLLRPRRFGGKSARARNRKQRRRRRRRMHRTRERRRRRERRAGSLQKSRGREKGRRGGEEKWGGGDEPRGEQGESGVRMHQAIGTGRGNLGAWERDAPRGEIPPPPKPPLPPCPHAPMSPPLCRVPRCCWETQKRQTRRATRNETIRAETHVCGETSFPLPSTRAKQPKRGAHPTTHSHDAKGRSWGPTSRYRPTGEGWRAPPPRPPLSLPLPIPVLPSPAAAPHLRLRAPTEHVFAHKAAEPNGKMPLRCISMRRTNRPARRGPRQGPAQSARPAARTAMRAPEDRYRTASPARPAARLGRTRRRLERSRTRYERPERPERLIMHCRAPRA